MKVKVLRYNKSKDHTEGLLFINDVFECYTLEDEEREVKVKGETCIPEGIYKIGKREIGGFNKRYSSRFSEIHGGMLEIKNVPNFKYILIHVGNDDEDTAGCLLVGSSAYSNKDFIGGSVLAYKKMYKKILSALNKGEEVTIEIKSL